MTKKKLLKKYYKLQNTIHENTKVLLDTLRLEDAIMEDMSEAGITIEDMIEDLGQLEGNVVNSKHIEKITLENSKDIELLYSLYKTYKETQKIFEQKNSISN